MYIQWSPDRRNQGLAKRFRANEQLTAIRAQAVMREHKFWAQCDAMVLL